MPALSFSQHKSETGYGGALAESREDSSPETSELPSVPGDSMEYHSIQLIRDEFLMNLQKFVNNIQRTMQQLEGVLLPSLPTHEELIIHSRKVMQKF